MRAYIVAFAFVAILLSQSWLAAAETEAVRIELNSDPLFENVNDPINIENATSEDTVIGEWRRDLGDDMPNGTYYGSLLPPATFKFNVAPSWWTNDTYSEHGRFTYATISAHFNLTRQQIMAGASEWWIRAPFDPVSIEASAGLIVAVFEDKDDPSDVTLYDGWNNQGTGRYYENVGARPTIDDEVPGVYVPIIPRGYETFYDTIGTPMTDWEGHDMFRMVNGHAYIRMDAVIMPSVDYVITFAFRLPQEGRLYTYWTSAERPTNNTSRVAFYEMEIAENGSVTRIDRSEMVVDLDLDFSFVFVEGVGYGSMFGKRLEVQQGSYLTTYPFLNTSRSDAQYPSFMLPFISKDSVEIHPEIHQGSGSSPGDSIHTWYFNAAGGEGIWDLYYFNPTTYHEVALAATVNKGDTTIQVTDASSFYAGLIVILNDDDSTAHVTYVTAVDGDVLYIGDPSIGTYTTGKNALLYCWLDTYYEYNDFILFSSNRTLDWNEFDDDDRWNVEVTFKFNNTANITLLCQRSARPTVSWSDLDDARWNSSLNPWGRPSLFDVAGYPGSRGQVAWMSYDVWVSGRGTPGQWAVMSTDSDGMVSYNYHFPQRIELSSAKWYVSDRENEFEWEWQELWEMAKENWAEGHYLKALWYGLRTAFQYLLDGGTALKGWVWDGLRGAYDTLKKWGEIIYSKIVEFFGWIYDVVMEAISTIAGWWSAFKYMVAPIIMIVFIGLTSRTASWLFMGQVKGVKA